MYMSMAMSGLGADNLGWCVCVCVCVCVCMVKMTITAIFSMTFRHLCVQQRITGDTSFHEALFMTGEDPYQIPLYLP